jgi:hypothetical protein
LGNNPYLAHTSGPYEHNADDNSPNDIALSNMRAEWVGEEHAEEAYDSGGIEESFFSDDGEWEDN